MLSLRIQLILLKGRFCSRSLLKEFNPHYSLSYFDPAQNRLSRDLGFAGRR